MIQDVKLCTHKIGTSMYAISKGAFLLGFFVCKFRSKQFILVKRRKSSKSINVGMGRAVATRMCGL